VDINKTIESLWTMLKPQAASIIRGGLKVVAGMLGGLGALKAPGSQEQFIDIGTGVALYLIGQGWSWWVTSGQILFKDQMEIYEAKVRAQAIKIRDAKLPPVTVNEITQNSVMDKTQIIKTIGTMPPAVQANIAGMTGSGVKGSLTALIAIGLLGALAWPGDASAQTRRIQAPAVTGDLKKDINTDAENLGLVPKSLQVTPTGNVAADLQTLWTKIVASSNVDLAYASKLAAGANTAASLVRKQCWDAIVALNEQANGLNLKNPDGTPMARPDPHLFTDVETLAEVVDNLSPQGPLFVSCAGAAQLAKTNVLTFINAAVTGAAGLAAMPIIPGL
jgi:hypothetical protein